MTTHETKARSLTKTIAWRIIATVITWLTIFFFTGKLGTATKYSLVAAFFSMIAYYLHERIWNAVDWGKL